jgi:hypothetical protein
LLAGFGSNVVLITVAVLLSWGTLSSIALPTVDSRP